MGSKQLVKVSYERIRERERERERSRDLLLTLDGACHEVVCSISQRGWPSSCLGCICGLTIPVQAGSTPNRANWLIKGFDEQPVAASASVGFVSSQMAARRASAEKRAPGSLLQAGQPVLEGWAAGSVAAAKCYLLLIWPHLAIVVVIP